MEKEASCPVTFLFDPVSLHNCLPGRTENPGWLVALAGLGSLSLLDTQPVLLTLFTFYVCQVFRVSCDVPVACFRVPLFENVSISYLFIFPFSNPLHLDHPDVFHLCLFSIAS